MKLFASLAANPDPSKSGLRLFQRLDRHSFKQIMYRVGCAIAIISVPVILASPSYAVLTELLKVGSRGGQVYELQERLNRLGYFVPVTGTFGSETESAVRRYQQACRLAVDGIVGSDTRTRLNQLDSCGRDSNISFPPGTYPPGSYPEACIGVPFSRASDYDSSVYRGSNNSSIYWDNYYPDNGQPYANTNWNVTSVRYWVVLVPTDNPETLARVRLYNPNAFINYSNRFGRYIQVGAFDDKFRAECVYRTLQRNFNVRDAHMRYAPI